VGGLGIDVTMTLYTPVNARSQTLILYFQIYLMGN